MDEPRCGRLSAAVRSANGPGQFHALGDRVGTTTGRHNASRFIKNGVPALNDCYRPARLLSGMLAADDGDWLALVIALAFVAGVILVSRWLR